LSKALKAQKDAEEESTQIAFDNLCLKVIDLRYQAIEKDKILISLVDKLKESQTELAKFSEVSSRISRLEEEKKDYVKRIANLESALSSQVELHKSEVLRLEEKLDEVSKHFEVEKEKRKIAETERNRVQRNVDELRASKE
jgi:predicted nuclease with TOPRIM domain